MKKFVVMSIFKVNAPILQFLAPPAPAGQNCLKRLAKIVNKRPLQHQIIIFQNWYYHTPISAFGIYFSIPNTKIKGEQPSAPSEDSNISGSARRIALSDVVKNLSILMPHIDNAMCYAGFGMIEAMLEPHMVQTVDATQRQVGYGFLISGLSYMFLTLIVGYVSKLCFTLEIRYLRKLSTFIFSFVTVQSIRRLYQSLVILSISFVSSLSDQSLHSR